MTTPKQKWKCPGANTDEWDVYGLSHCPGCREGAALRAEKAAIDEIDARGFQPGPPASTLVRPERHSDDPCGDTRHFGALYVYDRYCPSCTSDMFHEIAVLRAENARKADAMEWLLEAVLAHWAVTASVHWRDVEAAVDSTYAQVLDAIDEARAALKEVK